MTYAQPAIRASSKNISSQCLPYCTKSISCSDAYKVSAPWQVSVFQPRDDLGRRCRLTYGAYSLWSAHGYQERRTVHVYGIHCPNLLPFLSLHISIESPRELEVPL